jgi:hypothetical protein
MFRTSAEYWTYSEGYWKTIKRESSCQWKDNSPRREDNKVRREIKSTIRKKFSTGRNCYRPILWVNASLGETNGRLRTIQG